MALTDKNWLLIGLTVAGYAGLMVASRLLLGKREKKSGFKGDVAVLYHFNASAVSVIAAFISVFIYTSFDIRLVLWVSGIMVWSFATHWMIKELPKLTKKTK